MRVGNTYSPTPATNCGVKVTPVVETQKALSEHLEEDKYIPSENITIRAALRAIRDVNDYFTISNKGIRSVFSEEDKKFLKEALTYLGNMADRIK